MEMRRTKTKTTPASSFFLFSWSSRAAQQINFDRGASDDSDSEANPARCPERHTSVRVSASARCQCLGSTSGNYEMKFKT